MREMEFKMERQGLVKIGDVVDVTEREGFNYSYIIEPAVAMSGCYKSRDRLKSKKGVIKDIKEIGCRNILCPGKRHTLP